MEFIPEVLVTDVLTDAVNKPSDRYPIHYKSKTCYMCPDW